MIRDGKVSRGLGGLRTKFCRLRGVEANPPNPTLFPSLVMILQILHKIINKLSLSIKWTNIFQATKSNFKFLITRLNYWENLTYC